MPRSHDFDLATATPEERERERRRLWQAYRRAKAAARDVPGMMAAAQILGQLAPLEADRPQRNRRPR